MSLGISITQTGLKAHLHKVYVGLDEECYLFQGVNNNTVMMQSVPELDFRHGEADTRIVWHLSPINRSGDSTTNTDVLMILLYDIHKYVCKVWSPKINNQPLSKIKGSDPSMFPLCMPVLINKLLRANYVSYIWEHVDKSKSR